MIDFEPLPHRVIPNGHWAHLSSTVNDDFPTAADSKVAMGQGVDYMIANYAGGATGPKRFRRGSVAKGTEGRRILRPPVSPLQPAGEVGEVLQALRREV